MGVAGYWSRSDRLFPGKREGPNQNTKGKMKYHGKSVILSRRASCPPRLRGLADERHAIRHALTEGKLQRGIMRQTWGEIDRRLAQTATKQVKLLMFLYGPCRNPIQRIGRSHGHDPQILQ